MVHPASLRPPVLPDVTDSRRPPWIILNTEAYISGRANATRAQSSTSSGQPISVSFFTADPPAVSYFCVDLPGFMTDDNDLLKPPRIVCSEGNFVLIILCLDAYHYTDEYFMYTASAGHQPSLEPVPAVGRYLPKLEYLLEASIALVPCGGGGDHFVLAALSLSMTPRQYKLHIFRSELGIWTDQLLVLGKSEIGADKITISPVKVIMLGGGDIGWVDLSQGILVCNVLNNDPAPRVIPLPKLLPENLAHKKECSSRHFRDIICTTDGLIKLVERERCYRPILPPKPTDVSETEVLHDSESRLGEPDGIAEITYEYLGWRVITWERTVSSNCWRRGCLFHVDDILVDNPSHHALFPNLVDKMARRDLVTGFPILSMDGSDVVYFLCRVTVNDRLGWLVAFDMRKKTVEKLLPTSTETLWYFDPTYAQHTLSRYLDTTDSGNCCTDDCLSTIPPTKKRRFYHWPV